jgi:hypothetical protein
VREQELYPADRISTIEGVCKPMARMFELAGFDSVGQLREFDQQDRLLVSASKQLWQERASAGLPEFSGS